MAAYNTEEQKQRQREHSKRWRDKTGASDRARELYNSDPDYRKKKLEAARRWRERNHDKVRRNVKIYQIRNRIKIQEKQSSPEGRKANRENAARFRERNPWYDSWQAARQRCENPKNPRYRWYGARGIQFKLSKFDMKFLWQRDQAHLLKRPSIDRINNDGHYTLDNCRFIEAADNSKKVFIDAERRRLEIDARARENLTVPDSFKENE